MKIMLELKAYGTAASNAIIINHKMREECTPSLRFYVYFIKFLL
jgi:hypothetical protein